MKDINEVKKENDNEFQKTIKSILKIRKNMLKKTSKNNKKFYNKNNEDEGVEGDNEEEDDDINEKVDDIKEKIKAFKDINDDLNKLNNRQYEQNRDLENKNATKIDNYMNVRDSTESITPKSDNITLADK
eukprot:jgi/Orpsp1_1/1177880/evm.model.c7180000063205.1